MYEGIRGLQTRREDVLRNEEIEEMFQKLSENEMYEVVYQPKKRLKENKGKTVYDSKFSCPSKMVKCLIALFWIFGKRKIEILTLKAIDLRWDDVWLIVRFVVRKKKEGTYKGGVKETYTKRILTKHPYVKYITDWVKDLSSDSYLFSGNSQKKTRKVRRKWFNSKTGEEVKKVYVYEDLTEGHMSRVRAWKIIKSLNDKAWIHLFRRSLATQMAELGATEDELMSWFDWDSPLTAHKYVKRGTKLTEKWSRRMW